MAPASCCFVSICSTARLSCVAAHGKPRPPRNGATIRPSREYRATQRLPCLPTRVAARRARGCEVREQQRHRPLLPQAEHERGAERPPPARTDQHTPPRPSHGARPRQTTPHSRSGEHRAAQHVSPATRGYEACHSSRERHPGGLCWRASPSARSPARRACSARAPKRFRHRRTRQRGRAPAARRLPRLSGAGPVEMKLTARLPVSRPASSSNISFGIAQTTRGSILEPRGVPAASRTSPRLRHLRRARLRRDRESRNGPG